MDEVISIINSFRNTCSPGDDEVAAFPIKCAVNIIAGPLTHICNRMLLSGVFPSKLKVARVTVLFKGGNKNDPNNYRPISVLPLFSKLAERILYRRLNNFLQAKHLICPQQYGFQAGKSTESALLDIKNSIINNFETKLFLLEFFSTCAKLSILCNIQYCSIN